MGRRRRLYERFHRTVYRVAARIAGIQDAGDLTHDVFFRVFGRIGTFNGKAEFSTWLYRVAVNECLQHRRSRSRRPGTWSANRPPPEPGRTTTWNRQTYWKGPYGSWTSRSGSFSCCVKWKK